MTSAWQTFLMKVILTLQNGPMAWNQKKIVCHNEDFDKKTVLYNIIEKYENHFSLIKIKNNTSVKNYLSSNNTLPSACQVTSSEVNLILKSLNTKKSSGTDKIPTKFVKSASTFYQHHYQ